MSLINDALKRAKAAQKQNSPSAAHGLEFKPVEPSPQNGSRSLVVPAIIVVAAIAVATAVLWPRKIGQIQPANSPESKPTAAASPSPVASSSPASAPAAPEPRPVVAQRELPAPQTQPSAAAAAAPVVSAPSEIPPSASVSNIAITTESVSAKQPAPLKLQAILLNPAHPSAMISGKTLFIGNKIGDLRLVAIQQESVILVGAGQTNVLNLPQ
jgi:hypothetical protein